MTCTHYHRTPEQDRALGLFAGNALAEGGAAGLVERDDEDEESGEEGTGTGPAGAGAGAGGPGGAEEHKGDGACVYVCMCACGLFFMHHVGCIEGGRGGGSSAHADARFGCRNPHAPSWVRPSLARA